MFIQRYLFRNILQYVHETAINAWNVRVSTTLWMYGEIRMEEGKNNFSTYRKCNVFAKKKNHARPSNVCNAVESGKAKKYGKGKKANPNKSGEKIIYIITTTTAPFFRSQARAHTTLGVYKSRYTFEVLPQLSTVSLNPWFRHQSHEWKHLFWVYLYGHYVSAFNGNKIQILRSLSLKVVETNRYKQTATV